jgi:hypothetical protein
MSTTPPQPVENKASDFFVIARWGRLYVMHYPCRQQLLQQHSVAVDSLDRLVIEHVCPTAGGHTSR